MFCFLVLNLAAVRFRWGDASDGGENDVRPETEGIGTTHV